MIDREYTRRIVVREEDLQERVLPLLYEQIFHVTSFERCGQIFKSGAISTNYSGLLGNTFPQSNGCIGRHLNAVCLFDLRSQSNDAVQWALGCYYFLGPRQLGDEIAFLLLDSHHYSELLNWKDLDASIRTKGTYIPDVECWHSGNLTIDKISRALYVRIERRDLGPQSLEGRVAASWKS